MNFLLLRQLECCDIFLEMIELRYTDFFRFINATRREEFEKNYRISGRNYDKFLVDGDYRDILSIILIRLQKFY